MKLKTFLQISDIHISDGRFEDRALMLYASVPKLDGFLGHSYNSLTKLETFFADVFQNERAELILTGDLTRMGAAAEFDLARGYLEREIAFGRTLIGLRNPNSLRLAIPGNHDHYPGIPLLVGGPTKALGRMFLKTFRPITVPLGSAGHKLTFLRVNTDADVGAWGPKRLGAIGSFVSQLKWLGSQLTSPAEKEIRVLILHHSRAHRGTTLEIDGSSRDELANFIVDQDIAVLLSGHIHEPPLVKLATAVHTRTNQKSAQYLEARCGTTSQRNLYHIPYYWRNILSKLHLKKRGHWSNTLLVHRILEEAGEIFWESELFMEELNDFEPAKPNHSYCMVDPKVRIWPAPVK